METATFIAECLTQVHERLLKSLAGIGPDHLVWRPAPDANCILEILWHVARSDDRLSTRATGRPAELWESGGWRGRLTGPGGWVPGPSYQFLREGGGNVPRLETLIEYLGAIHADTVARLKSIPAEEFDAAPDPANPRLTRGALFRHMITHRNNHHGQVDLLRGLQEPGWDLPPGTGMVPAAGA